METNTPVSPIPEDVDPSRWPKTIGIISLIYAIAGFLCVGLTVVNVFLGEFFAKMGGIDLTVPTVLKVIGLAGGVLGAGLGLLMLSGAVALLRRRPQGVSRLKVWAVLRLVLLVVMTGINIMTLPAQMDMQRTILEFQNKQLKEAGRADRVQAFDEGKIWRRSVIMAGVFGGLTAVYPLFIGFYLGRRRITEEVRTW